MVRNARRWARISCLVVGTTFQLGLVSGACDRAANLTQYVDPCGTILADCFPGQFQLYASDVPNYELDPTCTIPGLPGCGAAPPSVLNPFVGIYSHLAPGSGP